MILQAILFSCLGPCFAQVEVRISDPTYGLQLPVGYQEIVPAPPGLKMAWRRVLSSRDLDAVVVSLEILPQRIGVDVSEPETMRAILQKASPGKSVEFRKLKWRAHEVLVTETQREAPQGKLVMSTTQIPLDPRAIQIRVVGPIERKDILDQDLCEILASISGKTNWLSPWELQMVFVAAGMAVLSWALYICYGIAWRVYFRAHPQTAIVQRTIWSAAIALLMTCALTVSLGHFGPQQEAGPYPLIGVLAILDSAIRACRLWNKRPMQTSPTLLQPPPAGTKG